ncbi:inorganic phosphate transporter [Bremerella sp. T1]|uniref:inorganic phosphate transporter n=1 Tax=Bremerella sp. TYQ1 TaxID=3119568 RepID=UPI001CCAF679|nr:inorganic phosphate transporter [Bremerella volcania]UBM37758.1 inorganic phosphate transporter [Bremerella volcania]
MDDSFASYLQNVPDAPIWMLLFVFALILFQEAINGFHDTANAIATVVYSRSLHPMIAVAIAAFFNFVGVLIGGTAVAFSLVYMLPKEMVAGINTEYEASLLLALIVTAVTWNFGTWWLGIPNSTTHAYVGSIMGVAMAHAFLIGDPIAQQINWHEAQGILLTLLISPIVGFVLAYLIFKLLKLLVKNDALFRPAEEHTRPPGWVRSILIASSAGVSLLHGTNDGQKSIGLMMLVMFGIAPSLYGLNPNRLDDNSLKRGAEAIGDIKQVAATVQDDPKIGARSQQLMQECDLVEKLVQKQRTEKLSEQEGIEMRAAILDLRQAISNTIRDAKLMDRLTSDERKKLHAANRKLDRFIEYVPMWIIVLSALALGGGTAIGYKNIVTTLGEKMGSSHMNPAQGTAAQLSAMIGIFMADIGGMPVSTTHVLSSGVAGTVVASPDEHLNTSTLKSIVLTWVTTLPGCMMLGMFTGVMLNRILA